MKTRVLFGLVSLSLTALTLPGGQASRAADSPAPKAKAATVATMPRGRLPIHYADVVDDAQKEKIYAIQAEHDPEIRRLKASLKVATDARDAAVAAVLTPDQQKQLAKIQSEAKGKKKGKPAMDADDDADDQPTVKADKAAPEPKKLGKSS